MNLSCQRCDADLGPPRKGKGGQKRFCPDCTKTRRRSYNRGEVPEDKPAYDCSIHSKPEYGLLDCYVSFTEGWEAEMMERQGGTCATDGCRKTKVKPYLIVPLAEGGANALWNVAFLCRKCDKVDGSPSKVAFRAL